MRLLVCALIQNDGYSYKKEEFEHRHGAGEDDTKRQEVDVLYRQTLE